MAKKLGYIYFRQDNGRVHVCVCDREDLYVSIYMTDRNFSVQYSDSVIMYIVLLKSWGRKKRGVSYKMTYDGHLS